MVDEPAVEVLPGRQLVAPEMDAVDGLAEADRVGDGNDDDLAAIDPAASAASSRPMRCCATSIAGSSLACSAAWT
jgi:hypothetical protein